jgi:hypothetical protein
MQIHPPGARNRDSTEGNGYRKIAMLHLNWCRTELPMITLADVASGDGRRVLEVALSDGPLPPKKEHAWPNQGPLPRGDWRSW